MTAATLRILHAPGYAPAVSLATVKAAEATGADSVGFSELYRVAWAGVDLFQSDRLRAWCGFSEVDTRAVDSPRGDAGDNPVAVRRRHKITGRAAYRVNRPGEPEKFAPERWITRVDYTWAGLVVTHVNAHPSPLFVGRWKWRKVMRAVRREVRRAQQLGHLVIVTGDLQSTTLPAPIFSNLGLDTWRVGVDWIAYDRRLRLVERVQPTPPLMDHPWLLATFTLRAARLHGQPLARLGVPHAALL
jgi:hypothetical protein